MVVLRGRDMKNVIMNPIIDCLVIIGDYARICVCFIAIMPLLFICAICGVDLKK
jgi:hypothetical protein